MDNSDDMQMAIQSGLSEVSLRVSKYDWSKTSQTPCKWQAIARHRERGKAWGVGVESTLVYAMRAALRAFVEIHGGKTPRKRHRHPKGNSVGVRKRRRTIT